MGIELNFGGFAGGKLSLEVSGDRGSIDSFDLSLSFSSGQVRLQSPFDVVFPSGWSGLANAINSRTLRISAFTLDETALTAGTPWLNLSLSLQHPGDTHIAVTVSGGFGASTLQGTRRETVSPFQVSLGEPSNALVTRHIEVYDWRDHARLDGVAIALDDQASAQTVAGELSVQADSNALLSLQAARSSTASEPSAVNLQDAIAILKMIVGLPVNGAGQPLSPYQSLAADFDGNGSVALTDAIGVLKHVVGLPAPAPRWMFANEADLSMPQRAGLSPEKPAAQGGPGPVSLDDLTPHDGRIGLVGVLRGDVDGSWRAPVGTDKVADNPANYFTELANRLDAAAGADRFNPSQWGVYGG